MRSLHAMAGSALQVALIHCPHLGMCGSRSVVCCRQGEAALLRSAERTQQTQAPLHLIVVGSAHPSSRRCSAGNLVQNGQAVSCYWMACQRSAPPRLLCQSECWPWPGINARPSCVTWSFIVHVSGSHMNILTATLATPPAVVPDILLLIDRVFYCAACEHLQSVEVGPESKRTTTSSSSNFQNVSWTAVAT